MNRPAKVALLVVLLCLAAVPALAQKGDGKSYDYTRGLLDCSYAVPIQCNTVIDGDNTNSPNNVELYSCSDWVEPGGEDIYILELDDVYDLTIDLSNNFDADLDIFLLTDCDEAACTAYADYLLTGTFGPGTYYIVIDGYESFDPASSSYTLSVDCEVPPEPVEEDGSVCNFFSVCYDWNFATGDHGFLPAPCDASGAAAVWQYGLESMVPGSPGNVWATVLNGDYVNSAGEGLLSPAFEVTPECAWMEVKQFIYCEGYTTGSGNIYDGCNVTVDDIVIPPVEGYTGVCNSGSPACVYQEEVFAGNVTDGVPIRTWGRSCFDLSQFMGMTIRVRFDFGSDSSVTRPGWYLEYVKIGNTDQPVPTEDTNWGNLKALYR